VLLLGECGLDPGIDTMSVRAHRTFSSQADYE
jgi:hypothetical protein